MPARRRMAHTVEALAVRPTRASSQVMRRYPQFGFSWAMRRTNSWIEGLVGGRSDRRRLNLHRRVTRSACQRGNVLG
jgi:hypothetical protein